MSISGDIERALELLKSAKDLEEKADSLQPAWTDEPQDQPWNVLHRSADDYFHACDIMKQAIKKGSRSNSTGGGGNNNVMDPGTRKFLIEQIEQFEPLADRMRKDAERRKSAHFKAKEDEMRRQQQEREDKLTKEMQEKEQLELIETKLLNMQFPPSPSAPPAQVSQSAPPILELAVPTRAMRAHTGGTRRAASSLSSNSQDTHDVYTDAAFERKATQGQSAAAEALAIAKKHDEEGRSADAVSRYLKAAHQYMKALKLLDPDNPPLSNRYRSGETVTIPRVRVMELKMKTEAIIECVEALKAGGLTIYEREVLMWSSQIASGKFLPWSDDEAKMGPAGMKNGYHPDEPWTDPDGLPKLNDKQGEKFHRWARPSEILAARRKDGGGPVKGSITMVKSITPYTIKQHLVSDCSFIAGLCVSAAFERRFGRPLVSSLIYPQDNGMPIYNPKGVYMVKLWLNGVERRVLVDDMLPVDNRGNLLCSHTVSQKVGEEGIVLELWVPILEKAYMKLCGGYDFPGSNSGVDLFSLTGWIPERFYFPEDVNKPQEHETPVERAWERLNSANKFGDCLATVSTNDDLAEKEAEEVGLITGHAYAVLGVVETSDGTRLLQLKNPWASKGWKGKYSLRDKESWKDKKFCAEVNANKANFLEVGGKTAGYDATSGGKDEGIFWMDWVDVLRYFRNIHVSWNTADPQLFKYRTSVHGKWDKDTGPADDSINMGDNPQYTITLSDKAIEREAKLWILLSRHVTKVEQEGAQIEEYFDLRIHGIKNPRERVWYPDADCKEKGGAYSNNQHILVRHHATGPEDKHLSIVLSHYKKASDLGYTLSCYCTEDFVLGLPEHFPCTQTINGSWKLREELLREEFPKSSRYLPICTAGGPLNGGSFGSNPQWGIKVPMDGVRLQVEARTQKEKPITVILVQGVQGEGKSMRVHRLYQKAKLDTGYRKGFVVSDAVSLDAGNYTLVASTHTVGQVGTFILNLSSSSEVIVSEIGYP